MALFSKSSVSTHRLEEACFRTGKGSPTPKSQIQPNISGKTNAYTPRKTTVTWKWSEFTTSLVFRCLDELSTSTMDDFRANASHSTHFPSSGGFPDEGANALGYWVASCSVRS